VVKCIIDKLYRLRMWLSLRSYPTGPWVYRYSRAVVEWLLCKHESYQMRDDFKRLDAEVKEAKRSREEVDKVWEELWEYTFGNCVVVDWDTPEHRKVFQEQKAVLDKEIDARFGCADIDD